MEDLLADHPDVAEVAVIGVDDEDYGQRLKAFVVTSSGASPDEAELRSHVRENLANYKVPSPSSSWTSSRDQAGVLRRSLPRTDLGWVQVRSRGPPGAGGPDVVGLADVGALDWAEDDVLGELVAGDVLTAVGL